MIRNSIFHNSKSLFKKTNLKIKCFDSLRQYYSKLIDSKAGSVILILNCFRIQYSKSLFSQFYYNSMIYKKAYVRRNYNTKWRYQLRVSFPKTDILNTFSSFCCKKLPLYQQSKPICCKFLFLNYMTIVTKPSIYGAFRSKTIM